MRLLLLIYLLLLSVFAYGQETPKLLVITWDSLSLGLDGYKWKFHPGDDPAMALPGYDDSKWGTIKTFLPVNNEKDHYKPNGFEGIGWFRLRFIADSSIVGRPLAFRMRHHGASQIYLDGKKIIGYGIIRDKDSTNYYHPLGIPYVFTIPAAGEHVLAVRYANYLVEKNYKKLNRQNAGFRMTIDKANNAVENYYKQTVALSLSILLLSGIFLALSLLHLFLFLYHRTVISNLYFSIFCLSLFFTFFTMYLSRIITEPTSMVKTYFGLFAATAACFSISGFSNSLFGKNKWSFRIITVLCLVPSILWLAGLTGASLIGFLALSCIVALEAVILTVIAMFEKVKGARIIGTGILLFTLFILSTVGASTIFGDIRLDDSTVGGQLYIIFGVLAVLSVPISMSVYLAWNFSAINKNLKKQLDQVQLLSQKTIEQEQERKRILESQKEELEREVAQRTEEVIAQKEKIEKQHDELKAEKKKTDDLLRNILPDEVAMELKEKGYSEAKYFDHVTVLFTDFVNFTMAGEAMKPQQLVEELHTCFKAFDEIISKYNIEKIKTIGDAYLAVSGLPVAAPNHAENIVMAAMEIREYMKGRKQLLGDNSFEIRIGIHSGSVVAGIVGMKKFAYDIWGDTVNTAARMEQHGVAGHINISQTTYELVKDKFICHHRGEIEAKNKGMLRMYFLENEKVADNVTV